MESTSQGNFEPQGNAYFSTCFQLNWNEFEAMETQLGTGNSWPGDHPHSLHQMI